MTAETDAPLRLGVSAISSARQWKLRRPKQLGLSLCTIACSRRFRGNTVARTWA